jgi:hypothetical protein
MADQDLATDVAQPPEAETTGQESTATEEVKTPVERTFTQHELDNIVQRRVAKAHKRIGALEEHIRMSSSQPEPQQQATDGTPKREDYQDYESYIRADAAHVARQEARQAAMEVAHNQESRRTTEVIRARNEKVIQDFERKKEEGRAKYADFDEVTEQPDLMLSNAMVENILDSDIGHELAYYLAQNPDDVDRISALSPTAATREMGKLEAKLASLSPAPRKSSAPAPINPLSGGREPAAGWSSDKASFDQFRKGLNKALYER